MILRHRRPLAPAAALAAGLALAAASGCASGQAARAPAPPPSTPPATEYRNGLWLDGAGFAPRTVYVAGRTLTLARPSAVGRVVDLQGRRVVPPLAETHSHAVEGAWSFDEVSRRYLAAGVFYVKVPNEIPDFSRELRGRLGRPGALDATFSHGGFTGPGGWPAPLYRDVLRVHRYRAVAGDLPPEWFDGRAYHEVATAADVERAWPAFAAARPDFVKLYLECSEGHGRRDPGCRGRSGLDPALVPGLVARAHAAGLTASVHVLTAADFRAAVAAGADEITHLPGWFLLDAAMADRARLTEADARAAAASGVRIQTTTVASRTMGGMRQEGGAPDHGAHDGAHGGAGGHDHSAHAAPSGHGEAAPAGHGVPDAHGAPGGHPAPGGHGGHGGHGAAEAPPSPAARAEQEVLAANLHLLRRAGAALLVGSDHADSPLDEAEHLRAMGAFSDAELLRLLVEAGPRAVFPARRVGCLAEGCEASFLALEGDPLRDLGALRHVALRVKDGEPLEPARAPSR